MYHALYRKYRPQKFDDVVGQEIIVKTLKNSIKNNRFSHAYMFFGPRGTGKTTVSKIFSRAVNCLDSFDGNACGKCKNCLHSHEKECVDIIEIDAASNNGVDEIRDLRNKISLVPAELKYKVYIIDEVHMLSIGAFNALLKTLEEPPKHAIFILATTDPQKVPETIVSRCQCFSFKRISNDIIVERLKSVCEQENIDIDIDALKNIALMSDGGLRDALGNLDKLVSYTSGKIEYNDFLELNGLVKEKEINLFCEYVFSGSVDKMLKFINDVNNDGKNLVQFLIQIMYYLRDHLINYYVNSKKMIFDVVLVENFINLINEKMFDIKKSDNPQIFIEIILLKYIEDNKIISREIICSNKNYDIDIHSDTLVNNTEIEKNNVSNVDNISNNNNKLNSIVEKVSDSNDDHVNLLKDNSNVSSVNSHSNIKNINDIMKVRINNTFAKADKNILKEEQEKRKKLNDFMFDSDIGYLVCDILDSKFRVASEDNIVISYEYDSMVEKNVANIDNLTEVYNKLTDSNKKFAIISDEVWNEEKQNYINNIKLGNCYEVIEEPKKILDEVFEEEQKNDIIASSAIELFGDIVEIQ